MPSSPAHSNAPRKEKLKLRIHTAPSGRRTPYTAFFGLSVACVVGLYFSILPSPFRGSRGSGNDPRGNSLASGPRRMLGDVFHALSMDFPCRTSSGATVLPATPATDGSRTRVVGFVGIQTGFGNAKRRDAIRNTWLIPSDDPLQMQSSNGLVFKFVIGKSHVQAEEESLKKEIELYNDFLRIDHFEGYESLNMKTLHFFKLAYYLYDADFYVKIDDDIYLRPDRLAILLTQERKSPRTYLGCMKKGNVIKNPKYKWYEPKNYILGVEYFLHAYGPIYALSKDVVSYLAIQPPESLRMFSNEDVTVGSWILGWDVNYEHNQELCSTTCTPYSIAVWDLPTCSGRIKHETFVFYPRSHYHYVSFFHLWLLWLESYSLIQFPFPWFELIIPGLCEPETKMLSLHKDEICSKSHTVQS